MQNLEFSNADALDESVKPKLANIKSAVKKLASPEVIAKIEEAKKQIVSNTSETKKDESKTTETSTDRLPAPQEKFLGMPKKVGIAVVVVGGLALLVGGYFFMKRIKNNNIK